MKVYIMENFFLFIEKHLLESEVDYEACIPQ